jgi:acetamidase/formamidase
VIHEIPLERRALHGHFSVDLEPVLTVDPGDSVRIDVPNAGWRVEPDRPIVPRVQLEGLGHALAGPIEVRGARAGQTLAVRIDEVTPGPWGITITPPPAEYVIEWALEGGKGSASGLEVELSPFLGVMGMPPPEPGVHPTFPPRPWGGNIDCKELVAGTTLFLPIPVDGALFSAGDGHALQGDGEVCGTAIECPARARFTLDVRDDLELPWPAGRLDGAWATFGFDEELGEAARIALDGMLDLMQRHHAFEREEAHALASLVVDLRVTQIANHVLGVHAVLRDDALRFGENPA